MNALAPEKFFSATHLENQKQDAPALLAEQAVRCLELVAELSNEKLDFLFKGGNSLLLILDKPRRFSIDVDIATDEPRDRLDEIVNRLPEKYGVFKRIEKRQHKTKPWLPMVSYFLYYDTAFGGTETFIMLDAMLKKSAYPSQKKKIVCGKLFSSTVKVELPKVSSIVSDKLLTLGPTTLGIPLGKNKAAQRLKHVHDVSLLLERNPNLSEMRTALHSCLRQELELQERKITLDDVLEDTTAFLSLVTAFTTEPDSANLESALFEIVTGRKPFEEHLFVRDYPWERLQMDAARCTLALTAAVRESVTDKEFKAALKLTDAGLLFKQATLWA